MRILAVDVGTGTQDILLFDGSRVVENCVKMIMPSPTAVLAQRISRATASRRPILFTGVTMGGGPSKRALQRHTGAGLAAYATSQAALTFNDDLDVVRGMGVTIVDPTEAAEHREFEVIDLKDLDLEAIRKALDAFGVDCRFDAVAVAVLDHGFAPPGVSNRLFRFQYLERLMMERNELAALAYVAADLPDYLTRMKAVARSVDLDVPVLLMDTGAAAVLGALQDREVSRRDHTMVVNMGNSHTVAFHLRGGRIEGFLEHHTNLLNGAKLDHLVRALATGTLTNSEVYQDGGHGAVVMGSSRRRPFVAIAGPRQDVAAGSQLRLHRAVPHGDMMLAGCYGLVSACGLRIAGWREEIDRALAVGA
ncbi:MAG: pyruvate formate lyase-activating protein [Chloroflexi bacterium]|nr:pyruvate formate lyase-activating protein [Chloroflexota bacterium]